ncbi:hypothetical protein [Alloactinosynnema sp. L-07]|uniref:restriction system modified-DNA reader domain-containing protein n=1 Tax=Alloactinosynnema sp. L-07 TaxID=1653480 RepID=UPI00065EF7B6|nr:hypothetical protein [Alloactinosynnema sp. L-07]CRK57620.1 hypothetical protein [Alloactinosynnema sp. L-07]
MPTGPGHPAHATPVADPAMGAPHIDGEAALRAWEGLSPEAMALVPAFTIPMRQPRQTWAMLIEAVDLVGDLDHGAELELFAASWLPEQPPADLCDGDLVVRLTPTEDNTLHDTNTDTVDVEMLLASFGHWRRVGFWPHLDTAWPVTIAPTADAIMGLHTDLAESAARDGTVPPRTTSALGTIRELLDAELIAPGEEFLWERRNTSVRHILRARADGTVALADGRVYATPTSAATELGGYLQDGWAVFQRTSDGRTLADLRTELHTRRRR